MSDILLRELRDLPLHKVLADQKCCRPHPQSLSRQERDFESGSLSHWERARVRAAGVLFERGSLSNADSDPSHTAPQLLRGEIVGKIGLFDMEQFTWVTAVTDALMLAVPRTALFRKLQQDIEFAACFYRAIALLLSEQILGLFEQANLICHQSGQVVKEALFFCELHDSDVDWMLNS